MTAFLFVIGFVLVLSGGIWLTLIMFTESILWGLLSLLLPIVGTIFVFTNWEQGKAPFLTQMAGVAMLFAGWALS
jgi:hypothetical protein